MTCSASEGMILFKLFLAIEHLLAVRLEVNVDFLRLRQHFVFCFFDVMPFTLGKHRKFCIAIIVAAAGGIQFRDQYPRAT